MKYKLLDKDERGLYPIQAVKNFGIVRTGETGGFIEKEELLSQTDESWLFDNATLKGNVKLENSIISGNVIIQDNVIIKDSIITGDIIIKNKARIVDSTIDGKGTIYKNSKLKNAYVGGIFDISSSIESGGLLIGDIIIRDKARTSTDTYIMNNISDKVILEKNARLLYTSGVKGSCIISGNASIRNTTVENVEVYADITLGKGSEFKNVVILPNDEEIKKVIHK